MLKRSPILLAAVFLGLISRSAWCYGPLNHFCVVAQNWDDIRPLIERLVGHPLSATEESDARRAALVGAFSLDLGYWPPSNQPQVLLTKASHYARTGEWAAFLLREAQNQKDPEAFAFALGALSHYAADRMGHYFGTNAAAVRLAHREDSFGARMSYDRDHSMHTVVEAGFDMFSASTGCASLGADQFLNYFLDEYDWKPAARLVTFLNQAFEKFYVVRLGLDVGTFLGTLYTAKVSS